MKLARILSLAFVAALTFPAFAQQDAPPKSAAPSGKGESSAANMEILRQKLRADKKLVVATNMELNDAQAKAFWPVYDEYQAELTKINQRIAKAIEAYASAYNKGPLADETAKPLLAEMIAIEETEAKMRRSLAPKVEKAVGSALAARYYQIEGKIRAVIRYELAGAVPLAN
jgi:hypothetical protein